MIKIVTGSSIPIGSTIALVNLCNQFNSRGHDCILYGPDNWHVDKCASAGLSEFRPTDGDVIIVNNIKIFSLSDLLNIHDRYKTFDDDNWRTSILDVTRKFFFRTEPSGNMKLILSCQSHNSFSLKTLNYAMFDKVHYISASQGDSYKINRPHFIAPNFVEELSIADQKPDKVAGIIGAIRKENSTASSIEQAVRDGMNTVIIYGYLFDPIYYYREVEPLTKKYPNKIKIAGFVDNKQRIYDSISDVYCSASKPWSMVRKECISTNTRYHGPDSSDKDKTMSNDEIFKVWLKELGL
jgi:hypothetical protein